jgi:hypothetical protein
MLITLMFVSISILPWLTGAKFSVDDVERVDYTNPRRDEKVWRRAKRKILSQMEEGKGKKKHDRPNSYMRLEICPFAGFPIFVFRDIIGACVRNALHTVGAARSTEICE